MVRAILDGRKTQTRRVVKLPEWVHPNPHRDQWDNLFWLHDDSRNEPHLYAATWPRSRVPIGQDPGPGCPYGSPGDRLWVRETWGPFEGGIVYRASEAEGAKPDDGRWHPAIHMHRSFSRIELEIVSVRVERLQGISTEDIRAEGLADVRGRFARHGTAPTLQTQFALAWDSINGKRAPWASNPWVWVVEFRRTNP